MVHATYLLIGLSGDCGLGPPIICGGGGKAPGGPIGGPGGPRGGAGPLKPGRVGRGRIILDESSSWRLSCSTNLKIRMFQISIFKNINNIYHPQN